MADESDFDFFVVGVASLQMDWVSNQRLSCVDANNLDL